MYEKSIELLNQGVADELWAVHQYMYFHFHCDDQGYDLLAAMFKRIAIQEMLHVEEFAERILFLGGEVDMVPSHEVVKIHDVREMLEKAMEMEKKAVLDYNKHALESANNLDSASKTVFEDLVVDEEGHGDQFETQLMHLDKFGEQYLALQSMERSRSIAAGASTEE
ncbi:MAG: ferritin-like domain-containing protein [Anaerolineae bacterium]